MKKPITVTVLDKQYEITYGPFGEYIIDGKTWDEFWDSVPPEVISAMAAKGMEVMLTDLEHAADIIDRLEL